MRFCTDCSSVHMGRVPCGSSFIERIRSVVVDERVLESRTKRQYWDAASADETFGDDRVDRYWEETGGHGHIERGADGELYHTNFKGERKVASDEVLASFVGGSEGEDVV